MVMKPLIVLFTFLLIGSSFVIFSDVSVDPAKADSLPSWTKAFHLHDGTVYEAIQYDWMNSSSPIAGIPAYNDYDGDTFPGITIRKNVPPQRWHHWILYPGAGSDILLVNELTANIWAKSRDNESASLITAIFFDIVAGQFGTPDSGTEIGRVTIPMAGPVYSEFQLYALTVPFVSYTLQAGHYLVLTLQRGDSLNDGLIVHFDKTDYDSTVVVQTTTFVSMDQAWTEDRLGDARTLFSDQENAVVYANVSDPFGANDIVDAQVSISYAGNGTVMVPTTSMDLVMVDPAFDPYWKLFNISLPALPAGEYFVNVTARDHQGAPSWINLSLTIVAVDHFGVTAPSHIQAGRMFSMSVTALDPSDQIIENWVGNVLLTAFMEDMVTPANATLANSSIFIDLADTGQVNITDQNYTYAEETIVIRASAGPHLGWSESIVVSAGPVVNISIDPDDPVPIVMASGNSLTFTVTGRDANDNVNSTWTANWSLDQPAGSLVVNGHSAVFTAGSTGWVNITCRNDLTGASDAVAVEVSVGALARLEIVSPSSPLTISESLSVAITAVGYDSSDNLYDLAALTTWTTNTSGIVVGSGGSAIFTAGFIPESGVVSVRAGILVASIVVTIVNNPNGPWLSAIPIQIKNEDSGKWNLSLSGYWHDVNGTDTLLWWVEDVSTSLFFVSKDPGANSVMQFHTQPDQYGEDEFELWVMDTSGFRTYGTIIVRILPVNDKPAFVNNPPVELYVRFDTPYTFDYSYYVYDVDDPKNELTMSSSLEEYLFFDRLIGTFIFPTRDGETPYFEFVTITLRDVSDSAELMIVVRVTSDNPPDLREDGLPDVELLEGVVNYSAFDLDDYFFDIDSSYLVYASGFQHLVVSIDDATHIVNMSAPEEWSGSTQITFTATDPIGALKTDTINVTIIAVNDAPIIVNPGTLHVKYDTTYLLYLSQYVYDPDNSLETLTFAFNDTRVIHNTTYAGAHILEMLFPATPMGPGVFTEPYWAHVRMTVSDLEPLSTPCDLTILVSDNSPPEVVASNPDQLFYSFKEDTYLNDTIRLYDIFSDPDDSSLTFLMSTEGNIYSQVYSNGVVNLTAKTNWSGSEEISIKAVDPHGAWASVKAYVTVSEVNDAPVIYYIENIINVGRPRSTHTAISMYFYDSDDLFTSLSIIASPAENVVVVGEYIYLSLPDGVDIITVTLVANDGEDDSNPMTFKFGVTKTIAERIGYPYSFPLVLVLAGVAGYFIAMRLPRPHALENLFLIHNDGRLVAHVTKEENMNLDKDVVSAMFTAVQEFVRDSFQQGEVGLKKLEIGDKNVVIEKGAFAYLALIYSGWPPKETFENMAMLLKDVEERFKGKLEKWNGTGKAVKGVDKMLQDFMIDKYKPGVWEEEELAEKEWVEILDKEA
ncbi:MAG: hypothetical protein A3K76_07280 [Euryarchaeota archaeon RBG_13_57_23]|nr:MAG: hypothetical protein A3K76_07280 [Euryarchaeota archaeon RBG_13_57_23]